MVRVIDMKKIFVICLVLSVVFLFCACNDNNDDVDANGSQTGNVDSSNGENVDPTENVTIDWETPIDVDDSFLEETTPVSESTEPSVTTVSGETQDDPTDPSDETTQGATQDPTEPVSEESTGESATEPVATKPVNSSGAIELPMIPG